MSFTDNRLVKLLEIMCIRLVPISKVLASHMANSVACSRTRSFNCLFFKIDKHSLQGMSFNKCYPNNVVFTNVLILQTIVVLPLNTTFF